MYLKPEQFDSALQKNLAPVYFFTGDEPLRLGEMADAVRASARKAGYTSREILSTEVTAFNWNQLSQSAANLSIFAEKKLLDLRLPSGAPGTEGAKALTAYCEHLPEDTVLLVTAGKVSRESLKARWMQALDKIGVIIQVWPLENKDLLLWLQQRMQQRGLLAEPAGIKILASRIEGNLLAAAQEVEKLYVLYGSGKLSSGQILDAVADSSRYDVFKLTDAILSANLNRMLKILSGLHTEGITAPVVLWALTRETRMLAKIKSALAQGQQRETVFKNNQVFDKRRQLVNDALNRLNLNDLNNLLVLSAKADRQSKGQEIGDAWETLRAICLLFASAQTQPPFLCKPIAY